LAYHSPASSLYCSSGGSMFGDAETWMVLTQSTGIEKQ
jgi:hypothetical protein